MFRTALQYGGAAGMLVTGLLAVPAAAAAAVPVPDLPAEVLAAYVEEYADVPRETLYARIALNAPRKKLLERFASERAATFGGSWYDYREGVWHVLATDSAAATAMAKDAHAIGVTTRTRVVRHSFAALHAKAGRIRSGRDALSKTARGRVGIDVTTNRVTVVASRSDEFMPDDPMVTFVGAPAAESSLDACNDRRNCGVPMRTGIILWEGSYDAPTCTLGFTARATDGSQWAYTAGHCAGAMGVTWGHGQVAIGAMRECGYFGNTPVDACAAGGEADISRIRISSSYWLSQGFGYLFHSPTQIAGITLAIQFRATIEVGDAVCLSGWHANYTGFAATTPPNQYNVVSNDTCGTISSASDSAKYGMPRVTGMSACRGDSGGGWFYYPGNGERWAYGTHSQSNKPTGSYCSEGMDAWFSSVPAINAFFDARTASDIRINTL